MTSATATELVINTSRLVTLGAEDAKTAEGFDFVSELNIGTTTSHVGGKGDGSFFASVRDDLSLTGLVLSVQDFVWDPCFR